MTLTRVVWGQEAEAIRNAEAKYITYHAPEGTVMLLVHFTAEYLSGPQDERWGIGWSDFSVEIQKRLYGVSISTWDKELGGVVYPGGTLEGWLELFPPVGASAKDVKLIYEPSFQDMELWFSIQ